MNTAHYYWYLEHATHESVQLRPRRTWSNTKITDMELIALAILHSTNK